MAWGLNPPDISGLLLFFLASLDAFQFRRNCLVNSRISLPSNIAAEKRHNSGNTLSFLHHLWISLSSAWNCRSKKNNHRGIYRWWSGGLGTFVFCKRGSHTNPVRAAWASDTTRSPAPAHAQKQRKPHRRNILLFFGGWRVGGGSPGNDPSVNAASPASASPRQIGCIFMGLLIKDKHQESPFFSSDIVQAWSFGGRSQRA